MNKNEKNKSFALNFSSVQEHEKNCVKQKKAQPQKAVHLLWPKRKTRHRKRNAENRWTDEETENDVICFANPVPLAFLPKGKLGKDFCSILDDNKSTNCQWHVAISNEKHPTPI
jgi:hypothetical protein